MSVSCLHFGQNKGKFLKSVSIRIFIRVLLWLKTYEYSLLGEQAEYDMETVHAERQNLRDQINALETQLTELTAE